MSRGDTRPVIDSELAYAGMERQKKRADDAEAKLAQVEEQLRFTRCALRGCEDELIAIKKRLKPAEAACRLAEKYFSEPSQKTERFHVYEAVKKWRKSKREYQRTQRPV